MEFDCIQLILFFKHFKNYVCLKHLLQEFLQSKNSIIIVVIIIVIIIIEV